MTDVILHDGRELTIDEYCITHAEYSQIIARTTTDAEDEAIFGKACGLKAAEIAALSEKDWRAITMAVVRKITTPDPT